MNTFTFEPFQLPAEMHELQAELRAFLADELPCVPAEKRALSWSAYDGAFSRKMGERGWIGMTWPKIYGGGERSALERYVVLEEMLTAGAPVAAHWIADRQSGPLLLRFGTEDQRKEFLPRIVRGELYFCIGMSEPNSGSDLASVRTKAQRIEGGWVVNGSKIWTTYAHRAHYMIALLRTDTDPNNRHAGLTQFLVDLKWPGITIRPIRDLAGNEDFNEVFFEDVFVPDSALVGEEGGGWDQVTAELANERSGPERYLSSYRLLVELINEIGSEPTERQSVVLGKLVARLTTLRWMSLSVAGMLAKGANPMLEASIVKDQGALFEQELPHLAADLVEAGQITNSDYRRVLTVLTQVAPSFSLRGGTREILRGIIARGLGLR